ncbi:MAG: AAA family ATPase [Aeromonadales bacterium]|nr:AAA family ATPase [Aeromonadales bacterium]
MMDNLSVKIKNIEIDNFKNTIHGALSLDNKKSESHNSVLALFGQNGSGKTSVIEGLEILQSVLQGRPLNPSVLNYINVDSENFHLKFNFSLSDCNAVEVYEVSYEFKVKQNTDISEATLSLNEEKLPEIYDEILSLTIRNESSKKGKKQTLIRTNVSSAKDVFLPRTNYDKLFGGNENIKQELIVTKLLAKNQSRSFIFSNKFASLIIDKNKNAIFPAIIKRLKLYAQTQLFVISTSNSSLISLGALPLPFKSKNASGTVFLSLAEPNKIPAQIFKIYSNVIDNMNIVLNKIVPKLQVGIVSRKTVFDENNNEIRLVELTSKKNEKEIPLKYESEGIRKIISVLYLLIKVYNEPSITVAIDDLDSGIFEYLLGEILKIISTAGVGQLIFTAHNSRALETIDKSFIAFTTTNKENRYTRLTNIKTNNNLRKYYYRAIELGLTQESLYDETDNAQIEFTFAKAGK